jgi:hypothetical protein
MTLERLAPFNPLRVHIANGRGFDVTHPNCLADSPADRTMVFVKVEKRMKVVDRLLGTSLEQLSPTKPRQPR